MASKNKIIEIRNKRAAYEYFLVEEFEAGIQLLGTEIKSIRLGNANISDAFCYFTRGELFVKNLFIAEYKYGNIANHEEKRERKLLLKKQELKKLKRRVEERGNSIVPISIYINERGLAKLLIALSKGKKSVDKRNTIKDKDQKRDADRAKAEYL